MAKTQDQTPPLTPHHAAPLAHPHAPPGVLSHVSSHPPADPIGTSLATLPDSPPASRAAALDHVLRGPWLLDEPQARLSRHTWRGQAVTLVRDDLLHPLLGGNKLRKLDALWPALMRQAPDEVLTCGGVHSAHCAAVATLAAERGLVARLLLRGELPSPCTGYALISAMMGQVRLVSRDEYAARDALLARVLAERQAAGLRVALIPEGAHHELALWGLIRLVHALAQTLTPAPWRLIVDSATGTTALGLALGVWLMELPWIVEAVELVPRDHAQVLARVEALSRVFAASHRLDHDPLDLPLRWVPRRPPRRFGALVPGDLERCAQIARSTGALCDPIYTLACWERLAQLADDARQDHERQDHERQDHEHPGPRPSVILHTGGQLNLVAAAARWPQASAQALSHAPDRADPWA